MINTFQKFAFAICLFLLSGCIYEVPLTEQPQKIVNPDLFDLWEAENVSKDEKARTLVLKLNSVEYLVCYYPLSDENGLYFRACDVEIDGKNIMQFQLLGTSRQNLDESKRKYHFAKYELKGDKLVVSILNEELISKKITKTKDLVRKITEISSKTNVFQEPIVFTKLKN